MIRPLAFPLRKARLVPEGFSSQSTVRVLGRLDDLSSLLSGPWRTRDDAPDHSVIRVVPVTALVDWDAFGIKEDGLLFLSLPNRRGSQPVGASAESHERQLLTAIARAMGVADALIEDAGISANGRLLARFLQPLTAKPATTGVLVVWLAHPPWAHDLCTDFPSPDAPERLIATLLGLA